MVFSKKISKLGKGENLTVHMETPEKINMYFFKNGVNKKEVKINNNNFELETSKQTLPYNEVIQINDFLITRLERSIRIIKVNE